MCARAPARMRKCACWWNTLVLVCVQRRTFSDYSAAAVGVLSSVHEDARMWRSRLRWHVLASNGMVNHCVSVYGMEAFTTDLRNHRRSRLKPLPHVVMRRLKGITVADAKNVSKSMDEADRELEMSQALASKATLEEMVLGRVVVVRCHVSELAGRQMVELWADDGEGPHDEAHSINTEMVRRGMARPFMAKYGTKANKSLSRVKETTKATASMDLPL